MLGIPITDASKFCADCEAFALSWLPEVVQECRASKFGSIIVFGAPLAA
jgi:hypothetical protein